MAAGIVAPVEDAMLARARADLIARKHGTNFSRG